MVPLTYSDALQLAVELPNRIRTLTMLRNREEALGRRETAARYELQRSIQQTRLDEARTIIIGSLNVLEVAR